MQTITKVVPRDFNLFLIGDDHEGSILRFGRGWNKMCDMANSEYGGLPASRNLIVHHGDFIEGIQIDDYRFDGLTTREAYTLRQIMEAQRNFEPIKNKLICMLDGNHPYRLKNFGEITRYFVEEKLKKPGVYGTFAAHITYKDSKGRLLFKHFATHGAGTIRSQAKDLDQALANKKASLKQKLKNMFGDTLLNSMGHTHLLLTVGPPEQLYMKCEDGKLVSKHTAARKTDGFIQPDFKWYANTGCFLKTFAMGVSSYSERANYDPLEMGFPICLVRDGKIQALIEHKLD